MIPSNSNKPRLIAQGWTHRVDRGPVGRKGVTKKQRRRNRIIQRAIVAAAEKEVNG